MSDWRNNQALVFCFNSFRLELRAILNNEVYVAPSFGGEIRMRRKQLNLSKIQLAEIAGVSSTTLYLLERNKAGNVSRKKVEHALYNLETKLAAAAQ